MMNTGDLQSRIGDEEDKKVIGMIAAKYFGDLPSVDMNNPIEVQQRLDFFLTLASKLEFPLWWNGLHWFWASNG